LLQKKIIYITSFSFVFLLFFLGFSIYFFNKPAGNGSRKIDLIVKPGWGSKVTADILEKENLIKNSYFFRTLLIITGNRNNIKKGIYPINNSMSSSKIIDILTSGKTKVIKITIPEGFNNRQIADLFVKNGFFSTRQEFLAFAANKNILKAYNILGNDLEGYLFPETYYIPVGYEKQKVIELMVNTFFEKVSNIPDFPQNFKERQQLIILASIIEKEAKLKEERPIIASVFSNRIAENYPLESCATIQYLFEKPKNPLLFKHLKIKSPYNTYINKGLPPGPIASPGLEALQAALDPAETQFKFFVVKKDGSHHFSKTFNEHVKAKRYEFLH